MTSFLLPFVLGGIFVLLSIDGVRVVFRGTRDYLSSSLSVNQRASKFAGTAAAVGCGVTGMALLLLGLCQGVKACRSIQVTLQCFAA